MNLNTSSSKNHFLINDGEKNPTKIIKVLDQFNNFSTINQLEGHTEDINCLILYKKNYLASGSSDKTVKFLDISTYTCIKTLEGHECSVKCLTELKNGNLASGSSDDKIKIWDENFKCIFTLTEHTFWITCLLTLHNGWLVSGSQDSIIKVWNSDDSFACIHTLQEHTYVVTDVIQVTNYDVVSIGSDAQGTIIVWGFNQGFKNIKKWESGSNGYTLRSLSNDMLASTHTDGNIRLWNMLNYEFVTILKGHTGWVYELIQLNDESFASSSDEIILWEKTNDSKIYSEKQRIKAERCFNLLAI